MPNTAATAIAVILGTSGRYTFNYSNSGRYTLDNVL